MLVMPRGGTMQRFGPWPERHGFSIGGRGPCYVLCVVRGSAADKQGLKRGDQIIELDEQRVSKMAAPALEKFAKHMPSSLPTLKVVNQVQHIELFASRLNGYGLQLQYSKRHGFTVDSANVRGSAFKAGIRKGDLVLEINGELIFEKQNALEFTSKVLSAHRGKISMAVLPIESPPSSTTNGHQRSPSSRNKNARELYGKMNSLFGENYEKKMAVIGVLKTYAEDRNIEKLARALVALLQTANHRKIIPYIRLHIPVRDRRIFDGIVQRSVGRTYAQDRSDSHMLQDQQRDHTTNHHHHHQSHHQMHTGANTQSLLYLRTVTVVKGDDNALGVVLKGSNPVIVETIIPGSSAESAGLLRGDCILKINSISVQHSNHYEIQSLLKNTDHVVQMEVIQKVHMIDDQHQPNGIQHSTPSSTLSGVPNQHWPDYYFNMHDTLSTHFSLHDNRPSERLNIGASASELGIQPLPDARIDRGDYSTLSSYGSRSTSSASFHKTKSNHQNREGGGDSDPFKQQVNYLLDKKERRLFKQLLLNYSNTKDIEAFVEAISKVLDTPSKLSLWRFILPLLSSSHQEYVEDHLNGERPVSRRQREHNSHSSLNGHYSNGSRSQSVSRDNQGAPVTMSSFKSQLDYLLTSRERRQIKAALQAYKSEKDERRLVEDLDAILDTYSKRSLWIHVLSLLPSSHQKYVRRKVDLPNGFLRGELDAGAPSYPARSHSSSPRRANRILQQSEDEFFVVGQDVENCASSDEEYDVSQVHMTKYQSKGTYNHTREQKLPGANHFSVNPLYDKHSSITSSQEALVANGISGYETIAMPNYTSNSYKRGKPNTAHVAPNNIHNIGDNFSQVSYMFNNHDKNGPTTSSQQMNIMQDASHHYEQRAIIEPKISNYQELRRQFSDGNVGIPIRGQDEEDDVVLHESQESNTSFNKKVTQALRAMDNAVLGTDLDDMTSPEPDDEADSAPVFVPPIPPAPPPLPPMIPVPPPLPGSSAPLQVKRLNWETHQPDDISNTVWGRRQDASDHLDIDDMVEYLELPQQFSTVKKMPAPKKAVKSSKMKILSEKKAFNTSIIIASLDTTVRTRLKEALITVDEEILSPHLLTQLLQYSPDSKELEQYAACTGQVSQLTDVDKFVYEMTRVPGYEARLKALYFKATFHEKCEVVEQQLHIVKMASQEVRHSKRLAKILELVLVMGNKLHKASSNTTVSAFKVSFLAQLDSTKTQDKKKNFLDILAQAVHEKFPDVLHTYEDLSSVAEAERVTFQDVAREITELQDVLYSISQTMTAMVAESKHYTDEDRFQDVMDHFINSAEDTVQSLGRSQAEASEEYEAMITYLGEKRDTKESQEIFSNIHMFLQKFEHAHRQHLAKIENNILSPRSPTSETYQFMNGLS